MSLAGYELWSFFNRPQELSEIGKRMAPIELTRPLDEEKLAEVDKAYYEKFPSHKGGGT